MTQWGKQTNPSVSIHIRGEIKHQTHGISQRERADASP